MHYVIGGHGPQAMVLLHEWPESWYEFHGVMPSLLTGRTVVAIDLPGLGDSTGNPPSYEKTVMATYVHRLLDRLHMDKGVQFVAHDFGVGVAYALAAQYRQQAAGLFLMDFPWSAKLSPSPTSNRWKGTFPSTCNSHSPKNWSPAASRRF